MRFIKWLGRDAFWLCAIAVLLLYLLPWAHVLSTEPATGGDTASHFLPLQNMLKQHTLRPWNPGNLAGEPQLVHYFPLSFILMAALSLVLPAGLVFNWLAVLPALLLPFATYVGLRRMGSPRWVPLLASVFSVVFLLNPSYSAWGGNLLSTLAGQFAHAYALLFFFLFLGSLKKDFETGKIPLLSGALAAAVVLSHAYIGIALPVAGLAMLLLEEADYFRKLRTILAAGLLAGLLSIWWIVPSLQSQAWTTPYAGSWLDNLEFTSYLPKGFMPYVAAVPLLLCSLLSNARGRARLTGPHGRHLLFWLVLAVFYVHLVWAFPQLGLVDIRAIPQAQLFLFLATAILLDAFLDVIPRGAAGPLRIVVMAAVLVQSAFSLKTPRNWLEWNWSGWSTKEAYADFAALNKTLKGDLSMPRVVYEHSELQDKVGTIRAFEMLPYFAGRATLESLYMQATVLAPGAYYLQSLVGEARSCPFPELPCGALDLARAAEYLPWFGVQTLILSSPKAIEQANLLPKRYRFRVRHGGWSVYDLIETVALAEAFWIPPVFSDVPAGDWKTDSIRRMVAHRPGEPWTLNRNLLPPAERARLEAWRPVGSAECGVKLEVRGSAMELRTSCPHRPHVIKMSYNPSYRADSGERLFPVYPGYVGLLPGQSSVMIRFGAAPLWKFFDALSALSWLALLTIFVRGFVKARRSRKAKQTIAS